MTGTLSITPATPGTRSDPPSLTVLWPPHPDKPNPSTIRVDREVYAAVLAAKGEVESMTGRPASMSDGVRLIVERAS